MLQFTTTFTATADSAVIRFKRPICVGYLISVQYFPLQLFSIYTHTHTNIGIMCCYSWEIYTIISGPVWKTTGSQCTKRRDEGRGVKDRSWETPGHRLYIQIVLSKIKSSFLSGLVAGKKKHLHVIISAKKQKKKQVKSIYMYTVHLKTQWMHINRMC